MFGDPIENEKGWRTIPLLQTGKCKNGMNYSSKDCGVEMHCLGVADFQDNAVIDDMSVLPMVSLKERHNTTIFCKMEILYLFDQMEIGHLLGVLW